MNQIVKFISTINSRLNSLPVENGNLIFVEDARKIVLDFHGKRAEYTQFVTLESEDQRLSLLAPLDLFYFVKGTGIAMFTLKNTVMAQFVIRIPVAYICSKVLGFGFYGVAIAWIVAPIYSNTIYTIYLKSGKWYERLKNNQKMGHSI